MSSVVRHLNAKWGISTEMMGQLMLFPYNTKVEELASCRRWTLNDSTITAREVYGHVGSPSIFRLRSEACYLCFLETLTFSFIIYLILFSRYGWFSHPQPEMFGAHPKSSPEVHISLESSKRGWPRVLEIPNHQHEQIHESYDTTKTQISVNEALGSDVNKLKVSGVHTGLVVLLGPIYSTINLSLRKCNFRKSNG